MDYILHYLETMIRKIDNLIIKYDKEGVDVNIIRKLETDRENYIKEYYLNKNEYNDFQSYSKGR